jgi:nucleoside-diphosphate-sugar epimerase
MARAIEWAMLRDQENGGSFVAVNTGSNDWNYQVKDLARAVAKNIPDAVVTINENAQPDKRSYRVNFDRFRQLAPNHQPQYDLDTTIRGLKEGLKGIGFADKEFRSSRFMRLRVLDELREKGALDENLRWRDV